MLGINSQLISPACQQNPSLFFPIQHSNYHLLQLPVNSQLARTLNFRFRRDPARTRFLCFAGSSGGGGGNDGELRKEGSEGKGSGSNGGGGDDGGLKNGRRSNLFNLKLGDLLDPDPENVIAVGLTCVLTWASVQVLWQLFFISLAIVVAALKYSFIAALLIFILIALL
ncbi:hypothetical protein SAY86_023774 [Trapa natans]|uniref:Transmembrane protein n=1 Tax=Trapa natans TaxID=22666 RepID=A0AAN7R639_TRANT|nr:hypothetical protein SAY86_023774 [Trapa natans]